MIFIKKTKFPKKPNTWNKKMKSNRLTQTLNRNYIELLSILLLQFGTKSTNREKRERETKIWQGYFDNKIKETNKVKYESIKTNTKDKTSNYFTGIARLCNQQKQIILPSNKSSNGVSWMWNLIFKLYRNILVCFFCWPEFVYVACCANLLPFVSAGL